MSLARLALRPGPLGIGLGCTVAAGVCLFPSRRLFATSTLRADAPRGFKEAESELQSAARRSAARSGLDVRVLRQISTGSIAGLVGGIALSLFSKPLTLLLGLTMLGVQYLESRGIHIVPYKRIQRWFGGMDVQSAMTRNVAFKLSLATTFTLAAFAEF